MTNQELTSRLHDNVDALIKLHNKQIGEVEKAIGVSVGYFGRTWNNRSFDLPITKVVAIAEYFGIELNDLIYGNYKKAYLIMQREKIARELKEMDEAIKKG